jgi:pimeloyl-ACP methyl ester carboxylesterase
MLTGHRPAQFSWDLISRIHFNTVELVKTLDVPVSVAHGAQDRLIPVEMGRQVYEAAKHKAQWLAVPDASHNDVSLLGGEPYWQWVEKSLTLPATSISDR